MAKSCRLKHRELSNIDLRTLDYKPGSPKSGKDIENAIGVSDSPNLRMHALTSSMLALRTLHCTTCEYRLNSLALVNAFMWNYNWLCVWPRLACNLKIARHGLWNQCHDEKSGLELQEFDPSSQSIHCAYHMLQKLSSANWFFKLLSLVL